MADVHWKSEMNGRAIVHPVALLAEVRLVDAVAAARIAPAASGGNGRQGAEDAHPDQLAVRRSGGTHACASRMARPRCRRTEKYSSLTE